MKIMTISDAPALLTGLGRVHRNVIDEMVARGHQVLPCGWFAYDSDTIARIKKGEKPTPLFHDSRGKQVQMLCVPKGGGMNCMYAAWDIFEAFKPDVILTIGDFWDFFYLRAVKAKADYAFKWVAYLTIEQERINRRKWAEVFGSADALVSPTRFGVEVMRREVGAESRFVPYGVDPVFRRSADRAALRAARGCSSSTLRLLTVAQNTIRKNLPALAIAAARLDKDDPNGDIRFHVHTATRGVDKQDPCLYDMEDIVDQLGVAHRFSFPIKASAFGGHDDQAMAEEYNAADWFVLPSTAEGFGLPLVESMACGVPAIAHSATAVAEHLGAKAMTGTLLGPRGIAVAGRPAVFPSARVANAVCPDALADAIVTAWRAWGNQRPDGMAEACEEYATARTWSAMGDALHDVVEGVAGPAKVSVEVL
jgi:glycosyltransferase involved in cell wall biosynthesis